MSGDGEGFVYCTKCGAVFEYMDLLVDHHAEEHETFDRAMADTLTNQGECE